MVNFTGAHYYTTSSNTATCTRTDPATAPYPDDTNRIFTSDSITPTQYLEYYINGVLIYTSTGINSGTIYGAVHNNQINAESTWIISSSEISWDVGSTAALWNTGGSTDNYISGCNSSTTGAEIYSPTYFKLLKSGTKIWIYEGAINVHSQTFSFSNDDIIKVKFAATPPPGATGARLPPPPIVLGGL